MNRRDKLAALLDSDLSFRGEDSGYASHDLHAFAARFPPQLPRAFIRELTSPGDIVLDPMMGSGTTLVEAILEGRRGIGLDLDPLALRLSRVKTSPLAVEAVREAGCKVVSVANSSLAHGSETIDRELARRFDSKTRKFIDFWFLPDTQREIMALGLAIGDIEDAPIRRFLELALSSIIVTKSGGVSLARDLAHSRPHRVESKMPKNAVDQFSSRLLRNLASISHLEISPGRADVLSGDARGMPIADSVVDLVVTSPPYANAIDYMRAHKFSLVWLGSHTSELTEWRSRYIGSERTGNGAAQIHFLPERLGRIVGHLAELDLRKAAVLHKYFEEMKLVLMEIHRVLRDDSPAIMVVGTSMLRGVDVQTHRCLADIAASVGFEVIGIARRDLDRNKRMMPARFGRKTDSMIEQRMHEEYVIGLYKS